MLQKRKFWVYAIVSILVTICISGFGRMSYGIMMPFMRDSLSLTYQQAGMLATATAIGYLMMVLLVGLMAAKWGSKRLVIIGLILLAAGLIYLFFVESYVSSLIVMVVLGVGTAFSYTPLVNIVVGWFPERRGLMIGLLLSGMGLGTLITSALIPLFNGWFSDDGWRYLWLVYGLITVLVTWLSLISYQDPPVASHKSKEKNQSLLHEVYLNPRVMIVAIIYGLIGFAYLIPQSFLYSFILESGIDEHMAGVIMGLGGFIGVFSGPIWGSISDIIGRKKSLAIVLFLSAISVLIPILFQVFLGFLISQIIWGLTVMAVLSLIQTLATEQTKLTYAPIAFGYVTIFFATGQILGPGLSGVIIDYFGSIPAALWLCFAVLTLGLILTVKLKESNEIEGKIVGSRNVEI